MANSEDMWALFGPFCGEIGWELCYWQAHGRWLKQQFPFLKFCAVTFPGRQAFYRDWADKVLAHDKTRMNNFGRLDCYRALRLNRLRYFEYVEKLCNAHRAYIAITTPDHDGRFYIPNDKMLFQKFTSLSTGLLGSYVELMHLPRPVVMLFPRHRYDERDWGEENWIKLADRLLEDGYSLVIAGIKSQSCMARYGGDNVVNLVSLGANVHHSLDLTLYYMDRADYAMGTQSFLPILSMHQGLATLSWGAEKKRHKYELNYTGANCYFIHDADYTSSVNQIYAGFKHLRRMLENGRQTG